MSTTNPKTLFFYGAFFPQSIDPSAPFVPQLALLSATFFSVAVLLDCGWAIAAARLRGLLALLERFRNRLTGAVYLAAALGLARTHRSA